MNEYGETILVSAAVDCDAPHGARAERQACAA